MTKIAIVGATGGLGREIAIQSAAKGYEVVAVVRDLKKAEEVLPGSNNEHSTLSHGRHEEHLSLS